MGIMSSIFVQIASLNDKELYPTVLDCLSKSSKKNDIYFGLHECYIDSKTDFDLQNVKISHSLAPENLGIGKGRNIANKFYNNEDYYLQVDAHSRFANNWDEILINDIEREFRNGNPCILTTYPLRYWYEDGKEVLETSTNTNRIGFVKDHDYFLDSRNLKQEAIGDIEYRCTLSTSGGFVFGKGEIAHIEHHPGIFFNEEMMRAAAFYTNGYNLMIPSVNVVYHLYGVDSDRKPPWELFPKEYSEGLDFSKFVIKSIMIENRENSISLGDKRSLYQYGNYIGVDFENGRFL
jgi:hypothetical protein